MIDIHSVLFIEILIYVVCFLMMLQIWFNGRKRFSGIGHWALSVGVSIAAYILIALRGLIPDFFSILVGNAFLLLSITLFSQGLRLFYGQRVRNIWYIAVIPVCIVLLAFLTFAYPDIGLRIIVINAFSFVVLLEILELLTRQVPVELRTKSVSLLFNVIFILALNVFRVIALLIDPPKSQDFFNQSIFEKLFMILNMLSLLYLILNLAMLVSRRLLMEISAEEIKFNTIFNHAPYASMITHAVSGRVIGINGEMLKLLGFQTNDVIGVSVADLKIWVDPKDREHVINRLKAGESIDGQEQVFRHRDGSIVQTLFSAVLVRINQENFIISTMKDIGEIIRLRTELKELASHDPMTKLPNRTQFKEYLTMQIAHCSRTGEKLAVIMFDVDDFKDINDTHGHDIGDTILTAVANRIRNCVRAGDLVARHGGDEFTLLLSGIKMKNDVEAALHRLLQLFQEPILVDGKVFSIYLSIGVSIYPDDGQMVDVLLLKADQAMYKVKRSGKNGIEFSQVAK